MYSPEIREDLIPRIYHAAKSEKVRMTTWVNRAVENELALREQPKSEEQRNEHLQNGNGAEPSEESHIQQAEASVVNV